MIVPTPFLRRALVLDAAASGATGLLLVLGGQLLAELTGLEPAMTRPLGLFLVVYAAMVAWVGMRRAVPAWVVWAIVALNLIWTAESVLVLVSGYVNPTSFGQAFVLAQAAAVAGFAVLQAIGLRRTSKVPA